MATLDDIALYRRFHFQCRHLVDFIERNKAFIIDDRNAIGFRRFATFTKSGKCSGG